MRSGRDSWHATRHLRQVCVCAPYSLAHVCGSVLSRQSCAEPTMPCVGGFSVSSEQRVQAEGVLRKLVRSNSFFRKDDKDGDNSPKKIPSGKFCLADRPPTGSERKYEGSRSVFDKLCKSGSFVVNDEKVEVRPVKNLSIQIVAHKDMPTIRKEGEKNGRSILNKICRSGSFLVRDEQEEKRPVQTSTNQTLKQEHKPDTGRKDECGRSVLNKLCRSGSFLVKDDNRPVGKLSSKSFCLKERPLIEKRDKTEMKLSRSGSFHGGEFSRRAKENGFSLVKEPAKVKEGGFAKLCRSNSFLRKESPESRPRTFNEGSLQATVFAPRESPIKSKRPATVLFVYHNGLDPVGPMRPPSSDLNPPRIDSYRFSMANLEESQDVDLDAILGELCALESQYEEALAATPAKPGAELSHRRNMSDTSQTGAVHRTDSPDNDSAFSDNVSLLSSESSASSGRTDTHSHSQLENGNGKAEKIRLALQKMKEASVKKLFIKVFSGDGSAKSLMVDETMSCGYVTRVLADKNHQAPAPHWALMEHLPDLHLERVYEDHEPLVDNLMIWTRDSKNRLLFVKRPERTMLFEQPELLSGPNSTTRGDYVDQCSRNNMIEELFSGSCIPSMEGPLYVKSDSKKGWKKHHCILRASGLYYLPKDKIKTSYKDLICLATFDVNQVYYGVGWRKKYKAPTEFGFALKHPSLQQPKSSKYIKFLCAEDQTTLHQWVLSIRMAKHGRQLLVNYRSLLEECQLSSCERVHVAPSHAATRLSTISSGSSLLDTTSESGSSGCDVGFECDFPSGTIKRKPPKIPLTATTRQLKDIAVGNPTKHIERAPSFESLPPPPPEVLENLIHPDEDLPPPPPPPPRLAPPSTAFLQDLQRVMRRKWQVAQKCKLDQTTTPHEVLGFRDVPDYKETNVSNWVAEHYGGQNLYENVYRPGGIQIAPGIQLTPVKKRPPPPPPRAETTQLSTNRLPQKC